MWELLRRKTILGYPYYSCNRLRIVFGNIVRAITVVSAMPEDARARGITVRADSSVHSIRFPRVSLCALSISFVAYDNVRLEAGHF